jgi:FtsP/CotA-like multicopper oxidase with cupredoxin domain
MGCERDSLLSVNQNGRVGEATTITVWYFLALGCICVITFSSSSLMVPISNCGSSPSFYTRPAISLLPLPNAPMIPVSDNDNDNDNDSMAYTLRVDIGKAHISGINFTSRLYNDRYLGGIIRAITGQQLHIVLQNRLISDDMEQDDARNGKRPWNTFRLPNMTNIHVHGMHVSPTAPSDDVFTSVGRNEIRLYTFNIMKDLPEGTSYDVCHVIFMIILVLILTNQI